MLTQPPIPLEKIGSTLQLDFNLTAVHITFLPLGRDLNTAVYHIQTPPNTPYLFKLRSGPFNPASVTLPHYLHQHGLREIIPPLPAKDGRLTTTLDQYTTVLYPYIEGQNGYQLKLSDHQWLTFGALMKRFHTANLPPEITGQIPHETYSPHWRQMVSHYLDHAQNAPFDDPLAAELAQYLIEKQPIIDDLLHRVGQKAAELQTNPPPQIVCHADIHAGNLHLTPDGRLYLIDWDTLIIAPKERDLMSIGADLMGGWYKPQEEHHLFYQGYGQTPIHLAALTYYRCHRIIEDIAVECQQIFTQQGILEDRQQALHYLKSNFHPNSTITLALNR